MVLQNLKDAYLHVPIYPSHWRLLRFALMNAEGDLIVYQWKVLPFGLVTTPRVSTKSRASVAAHLHLQGSASFPLMYPYTHRQQLSCSTRHVTLAKSVSIVTSC